MRKREMCYRPPYMLYVRLTQNIIFFLWGDLTVTDSHSFILFVKSSTEGKVLLQNETSDLCNTNTSCSALCFTSLSLSAPQPKLLHLLN